MDPGRGPNCVFEDWQISGIIITDSSTQAARTNVGRVLLSCGKIIPHGKYHRWHTQTLQDVNLRFVELMSFVAYFLILGERTTCFVCCFSNSSRFSCCCDESHPDNLLLCSLNVNGKHWRIPPTKSHDISWVSCLTLTTTACIFLYRLS